MESTEVIRALFGIFLVGTGVFVIIFCADEIWKMLKWLAHAVFVVAVAGATYFFLSSLGDDNEMTEEEISNQAYYDAIDYCREQQRKGKEC